MGKIPWYEHFLRALFPRRCPFCGNVVGMDEGICADCESVIKRQNAPICIKCGRAKIRCACHTFEHKPSWDGAVSAFVYDSERTGDAVRRLKDSDDENAARVLGTELAKAVKTVFGDVSFDCVMPSPMHPKDKLLRGYSQSEWIAKAVADELGLIYEDRLKKIRQTRPQKQLSKQERLVNLRGTIDLDERYDTPDKTVLVVDDVMTTGATLNESATILKIYGARAVYVAAVCATGEGKEAKQDERNEARD